MTITATTTRSSTSASHKLPVRHHQRIRRAATAVLLSTAICGTLALTAMPASASTSGTVGGVSQAACGWYIQPGSPLGLYDYKITQVDLPSVTGTTAAAQLVWLHVQFTHPNAARQAVEYRGYWLYQYARAGIWNNSWTDTITGNRWVALHDFASVYESGVLGAESINSDTMVIVSEYWTTGNQTTGFASQWAWASRNANNNVVCNGGGNFA